MEFSLSLRQLLSVLSALLVLVSTQCYAEPKTPSDIFWRNATVYFMLTDRFKNGDLENDRELGRGENGAVLRNFVGGDIRGITQKIREGYFTDLGVDVLWMTPLYEQIHGYWEDDWGDSYPFHGYWPLDWTAVDPNFGSESDMQEMIEAAHQNGIRVLADVILNHTGPKTKIDPAWPEDWIRTKPLCDWSKPSFQNTVTCALAPSLTDIKTESDTVVGLPPFLIKKWEKEGRLEQEMSELDSFFGRTGLARVPRNYIIKWITDWVRDYGIDGFRVDTAKHVEPEIWQLVKREGEQALEYWRSKNRDKALGNMPFHMLGEVYEFGLDGFKYTPKGTRKYDYGDRQVDFFSNGFDALINMGFATHAAMDTSELFALYSRELNNAQYSGKSVLNYLVSHDDPNPFDRERENPYMAAVKLLLAPGAAQIYYGDELARPLFAKGAIGDAHWRVPMNWEDLEDHKVKDLLAHWQKLGRFRRAHPAVGAGRHIELHREPLIFVRELKLADKIDRVLVALDQPRGPKTVLVSDYFRDGVVLKDHYSGKRAEVHEGKVTINTEGNLVLMSSLK